MKPLRLLACGLAAALSLGLTMRVGAAEAYPTKPIRFIVPVPPGNAGDLIARVLADNLSKRVKQPVIVDNRPGAGGNIGADYVAKAPADGYTVLLASSGVFTTNQFLYKLSFDPLKDFIPVTQVFSGPPVLIVGSTSPFKSVQDVIDAAKKHPGTYSFASYGVGHISHIIGEMFQRAAGISLIHVPYKNSPIPEVMSGQVDMMFDSPLIVLGNKERLRPLATGGAQRNPRLPSVPALAEQFPGFEMTGWLGAFVPAKTPPDVVASLYREMAAVIHSPEFQQVVEKQALDIGGNAPAEFSIYIREMAERVGGVIQAANIKAD